MSDKMPTETTRRNVGFPSSPATVSKFRLLLGLLLGLGGAAADAGLTAIQDLESLRGAAQSFLEAEAIARSGPLVAVEIDPLDPRLRLSACSRPLEAFLAPASRLIGPTSVGVRCTAPKPWKVYLQARVTVRQAVVVSARALPRNSLMDATDVTLREVDLGALNGGFFTEPAELLGMKLIRSLGPNQVITPSMLRQPLLIRRGEMITLVSSAGNLEVRASGRALTDGTMGGRIEVEAANRRRLDGEVIGPGLVRMGQRR